MTVIIKNNLRKLLSNAKISVRDFERRAGLKSSTIQNILRGRSKNPTIKVLQLIAQELNCSVDSLIKDPKVSEIFPSYKQNNKIKLIQATWDGKLFINTSIMVNKICLEKKNKSSE